MAAHLEDVQVMAVRWLRERGGTLPPEAGDTPVSEAAYSG